MQTLLDKSENIIYKHFLPFNPLLDDKIVGKSKLKAFAEEEINVAGKLIFVLGMVENIVGK